MRLFWKIVGEGIQFLLGVMAIMAFTLGAVSTDPEAFAETLSNPLHGVYFIKFGMGILFFLVLVNLLILIWKNCRRSRVGGANQ